MVSFWTGLLHALDLVRWALQVVFIGVFIYRSVWGQGLRLGWVHSRETDWIGMERERLCVHGMMGSVMDEFRWVMVAQGPYLLNHIHIKPILYALLFRGVLFFN
jgi:hypothetical protein